MLRTRDDSASIPAPGQGPPGRRMPVRMRAGRCVLGGISRRPLLLPPHSYYYAMMPSHCEALHTRMRRGRECVMKTRHTTRHMTPQCTTSCTEGQERAAGPPGEFYVIAAPPPPDEPGHALRFCAYNPADMKGRPTAERPLLRGAVGRGATHVRYMGATPGALPPR